MPSERARGARVVDSTGTNGTDLGIRAALRALCKMGDRSRPEGDLVRVLVDIAIACGILVVPIAALDVALTRRARRARRRAEEAELELAAHETADEHGALTHH
jgi:hypothetical protein